MSNLRLTPTEEELVLEHRRQEVRRLAFCAGLEAAARKVEAGAQEAAGGAGVIDSTARMYADAIRRIDPDKGY